MPVVARTILVVFCLLALLAPSASAQLRVGNLTHILPQCQTACDAYDVMTTGCNGVGIYDITYIYCECTPTNLDIIEDCFNCQSVNATQEATMQQLLDDIVNMCNEKVTAQGSTVSISAQQIEPSPSTSATNDAHIKIMRPRLWDTRIAVLGAILGALLVFSR
ncbi:hypothetical protein C8R47DRAFT_1075432 [Mycena vitilis]|nr:hypothetical protein C8R47DRAFT_1075432 [Mycena vitilis]